MNDAGDSAFHVLVVDDDQRLRTLLQRYLTRHGFHVTAAEHADDARAALARFHFDILVLDVMMPGDSGFVLTAELRGKNDVPILLLTARQAAEDRIHGLEVGADDYLVKPFEPRELLLRIQKLLERSRPAAPAAQIATVRFGPFTFDRDRAELRCGDAVIHLTTGERQMLSTLARQPGEPVARTELAPLPETLGSDRAVDAQMMRLRRKVETNPKQPRYLVTVRGKGYALVGS